MFGKKRKEYEEEIRKLEFVIHDLKQEISDLKEEVTCFKASTESLEKDLDNITKMKDSTPEDCKRGEWCKACEFSRIYFSRVYHGGAVWRSCPTYMCGKGESCKNFVQRKEEE